MSHIPKELHSFIQSMTSYEKKRLTMKYNKSDKTVGNSMVLFNGLKKLKKYDDEALIKYLQKNGKGKLAKNLAKEITILWKVILKVLNNSVETKSIEEQLWNNFKDIKFLQKRGCIVKSWRMLKKLIKDAELYDQKKLLLQVYEFERERSRLNNEPKYLKSIEQFNEKETKLIEGIALEQKLRHIFDKVFYLVKKFGMLRKDSDNELLVKMEAALYEIDRNDCNCFGTQLLYLTSMELLYLLKSDADTAFKYITEMYQVYEKHTAIRKSTGIKYIKFLTNYLNHLIRRNISTDEFSEFMAKMKSIKLNTHQEETLRFNRITYTEFSYYLHRGDFEKLESTIPTLLEGLKKYIAKIDLSRKTTIWYNVMIFYFLKEDFYSADSWIGKILNEGNKSKRLDILNYCNLFDLVVTYELGKIQKIDNSKRLKSLIRTVKRNFKEADNSNELVNLVAKMMNAHCDKAHLIKKDFELALKDFDKIDKTKNPYLPYDEIEIWLKSKVQRKPMQKIAEQMLQNKK